MTSEQNAYGIVTGQWFDGAPAQLHSITSNKIITIVGVTEYENIDQTCSKHSYYEKDFNTWK